LEERSALHPYLGEPFDLVIGNPPYFQFRAPREVRTYFAQVISGRPNIFALFFQAGMEALSKGGRLAYVVPPSMNNGAYFEALREYIVNQSVVDHLEVLDGNGLFEDANTAVQLIVMKTGETGNRHVFERRADSGFRRTIFSQHPERLAAEFESRRTLSDLGYEAVTGTIVWNQNRERLRLEPDEGTVPLLWAHNIVGEALQLGSTRKRPQYVEVERRLTGPAIIVNRIVGAVGAGELRCALVPEGMEFVGENHVNVIRVRHGAESRVAWGALLGAMRRPEVASRLRLLTGNTQISATELTYLLPLDL
jgi:adenine-specific DNA-methyltransferase